MEPIYTIEFLNGLSDQRKKEEREYIANIVRDYVFKVARRAEAQYTACIFIYDPRIHKDTTKGSYDYSPSRDELVDLLKTWFPRVEAVQDNEREIMIDWTDTANGKVQNMYTDRNSLGPIDLPSFRQGRFAQRS